MVEKVTDLRVANFSEAKNYCDPDVVLPKSKYTSVA